MSVSRVPPQLHHLCFRLHDDDDELDTLDLGGMNIGKNGAIALGRALERNSCLQVLNVSYNLIPPSGAAALLKGAHFIKTLDLRHNSIADGGAEAVGEVLSRPDCTLKHLRLRNNYIGVRGATALMKALMRNESLEQLDLGTNVVGNEGARAIGEVLQHNQTLKWLRLSTNGLDADGVTSIAEGLADNGSLEVLHLGSNSIGDEGSIALSGCLYQNRSLKSLHLANSRISEAGALALAKALRHNNTLQVLDLLHNPIGVNGIVSFKNTLERSNTTLTALLLDHYHHHHHHHQSQSNTATSAPLGLRRINHRRSTNAQIAIYLKLNQAGRSYMYNVDLPSSTWSNILAEKVGKEPDLVYLTILEKPDLFR